MGSGEWTREIDGYYRWMSLQIIALLSQRDGLPHFDQLECNLSVGVVREGVVVPDPEREYFEFDGGNLFSWSTKNLSEHQRESMYKLVTDNIINGTLVAKQALPSIYHNLILAEAIKGNRSSTVVRYLELCKSSG